MRNKVLKLFKKPDALEVLSERRVAAALRVTSTAILSVASIKRPPTPSGR